ncbi:MAG: hypothetical protein WCO44_03445 [Bacteroidota bacterium]
MKHTIHLLFMALILASVISCSTREDLRVPEASDKTHHNPDSILLSRQTSETSLAIAIVDDISGSYTLNPECRNTDILSRYFALKPGRKVLGYTNIQEDSYTPILRYNYIPKIANGKNQTANPWITNEQDTDSIIIGVNAMIDSLNTLSYKKFREKVEEKLNRKPANRSDVVNAIKRATTFLNEFAGCSGAKKIMIVLSDFFDTNGHRIKADTSITLYIVGSNIIPSKVKDVTGLDNGSYRVFESYEEVFNDIINH